MRVEDLFRVEERFMRSVHLERDFVDPNALAGYVVTPQSQKHLETLIEGLNPQSKHRAWRVTGDYGAGKSSFALYLAQLLSQDSRSLPAHLRQKFSSASVGRRPPRLLPILVTGSREPLSVALLRALRRELSAFSANSGVRKVSSEIKRVLESENPIADETVINLLVDASRAVAGGAASKTAGLLIILDELGKFLEYAALHPDRQDVFLLQRLGEEATRSGETPIFVVGLLHQGFSEYASGLSITAQREWTKVSQRFEEIVFEQPLEQIAGLVGDALNLRLDALSIKTRQAAREAMNESVDFRWYGAAANKSNLLANAERIYPIHPTVIPILVKLFGKFGQNQRSLFSFLMSNEAFGLREFAQQPFEDGQGYRLAELYDYTRAAFGHYLGVQGYRSHWNLIGSTIDTISAEKSLELRILKTVGMFNLIDTLPIYAATEDAIVAAVADEARNITAAEVRACVKTLKTSHTLYFRGVANGFCLWSNASVNLESAYEQAVRALGKTPPERVSPLLQSYLETRPLVARRHYIETGNLRHFEVRFVPVADLATSIAVDFDKADGCVVAPLCENEEDYTEAIEFARRAERAENHEVLLAVSRPLNVLGGLYQEVQRWEWVLTNTPELNHDKFAREEATRQYNSAKQNLDKRVNSLIGIQSYYGESELAWFYRGQKLPVKNSRELLERLSSICDEIYWQAPRVRNELINRRAPSPPINGARTRLLERIFGDSDKPYLGMNPDKKPPEMAIYLSLLKDSGLHRQNEKGFALLLPETEEDKCNFLPALNRIEEILTIKADSRVKVSDVLTELRRAPFGIRDGLSPILLAIFAVIRQQHIAFYYEGAFMREMAGLDIKLLTKVPGNFEIQYCRVAGVRTELFKLLSQLLERLPETPQKITDENRETVVLDIVRPLCVFAASLPQYTLKTSRLSATAITLRRTLLNSREPAMLLFRDLPATCGFGIVTPESPKEVVAAFVEKLQTALEELRLADTNLRERMKRSLADFFEIFGKDAKRVRETLAARAEKITAQVTELRLKGFCLCLEDAGLGEAGWLDALGSFVCSVPPNQWQDLEEEKFVQELGVLVGRFKRVESMVFDRLKAAHHGTNAVRVAVTNSDGTEMNNVIFISRSDERKIARIEAQVLEILNADNRLGMAATARAFYKILAKNETQD